MLIFKKKRVFYIVNFFLGVLHNQFLGILRSQFSGILHGQLRSDIAQNADIFQNQLCCSVLQCVAVRCNVCCRYSHKAAG